ncbi:MAG: hypothetical protein A4E38_00647 [Methanoregulaceae archaeon PtaB.Bin108]|nr:MAG: hypothetical protein A4E38_00647 [Methanoregulaceae archaeon PtaB.Bin108]OPY46308.1 MAG: hypothetical protein A4E42_00578 [Methanoregulaceae archaeon PtaU1.Bin222]
MMLILAVVVTLFSLWNSVYLPGLKQQAEVEHLSQVEEGFLRIDADIKNMISLQSGGTMIENIPLGGGDFFLHSTRSGGSIRIARDSIPLLIVRNSSITLESHLARFNYSPLSNFWIDQGYTWQEGYVNVTKGGRSSPLRYDTMDTVIHEGYGGMTSNIFMKGPGKDITLVNFLVGDSNMMSGNGISQFNVRGNTTRITLEPDTWIVANVSTAFGASLNETISTTLLPFNPDMKPEGPERFNYTLKESITIIWYNLTYSVV